MKYVLMQAPQKEEDYSAQIVIVDNSNIIGKREIDRLIEMGYTSAGIIESNLRIGDLQSGFNHNTRRQVDILHNLMLQIGAIADSHVDAIYMAPEGEQ